MWDIEVPRPDHWATDMLDSLRDPRQARFLTVDSLRWVVRNKAWTPWYLTRYARFARLRLQHPHVVTEGFVFLGDDVEILARRGHGRIVLGPWVHIGDGNALRCHEGTLRIGAKTVLGKDNTVNCYLDIEFGERSLVSDWVYVCDFDHIFSDIEVPIKDQGIVKAPVRIGPDCWVGTKATILRGVTIGEGSVIAAHAVVAKDIPALSVAVGAPARVVRDRRADYEAAAATRAALADIARKTAVAAAAAAEGTAPAEAGGAPVDTPAPVEPDPAVVGIP